MLKKLLIAAIASVAIGSAFAADTDFAECRQVFANGTPPVLPTTVGMKLRPLCFSSFAVMHSGKSRTPVYVAERLNRADLLEARKEKRTNKFFADARLPRSERAELEDYKGSGLDRGHMAPAADMSTPEAMAQCFSLANMVPQAPINNRKAWASIEKATRKYAMRAAGDVFVITGPVFEGSQPVMGKNQVWVPKYLFKLVYDPTTQHKWAHWIVNANITKPGKPISYEELVQRTGIQFFPDLK